jgi:hypothetical protein
MTVRFLCSILLATAYAAAVYAEAERPALDKYKATFEQELVGINEQSARAATNWPVQYVGALKSVEQRLKEAGDLDGLLAVRQEQERFGRDRTIPDEALVEKPAELRSAQLCGRRELDSREVERCRRVVGLADRHVANLESLKRNLTREDKVDYAIAVKAEIDAVKARPDVTAAQFVVAAAGVDTKSAAPPQQAKPPPQPQQTEEGVRIGLPQRLQKGLVLYYSFNKNEGDKVTDESGNGNNGKAHDIEWVPRGKIGGAYEFRGNSGGDIDIGRFPALQGASEFTIAMWARRQGSGRMFGKGGSGYRSDLQISWYHEAGLIMLAVGTENQHLSTPPFGDGGWHYVACTLAEGRARIYVDGELAADGLEPDRVPSNSDHFFVGNAGTREIDRFDGMLDEVMVFDRALPGDEIRAIYDQQAKAR